MKPRPCTLLVLRHAEKGTGADPDLTPAGNQRAIDLASLLKGVSIQRMYCTEYIRTRQTLEPLSEISGAAIETISAEDAPRWRRVVSEVEAGETIVICGHQNTVPLFVEEAGGEISGMEMLSGQPWIPGHIFDRLYMVSWQPGESRDQRNGQTLELRFGVACD